MENLNFNRHDVTIQKRARNLTQVFFIHAWDLIFKKYKFFFTFSFFLPLFYLKNLRFPHRIRKLNEILIFLSLLSLSCCRLQYFRFQFFRKKNHLSPEISLSENSNLNMNLSLNKNKIFVFAAANEMKWNEITKWI